MTQHCGYIALLGRPNAGKSTLLNAAIGMKIAGVSNRPQTTRNQILGVDTLGDKQIIFLDTPGLHKSGGKPTIHRMMNKEAWNSFEDADLICYLIDIKRGWHSEDERLLTSMLKQISKPVIIIASKVDSVKKHIVKENSLVIANKVQAIIEGTSEENRGNIKLDIPFPLSAKRPEEVKNFRQTVADMMPEAPFQFSEDDVTNRSQNFITSELIREHLFRQLGDELPYGTSVVIESFEDQPKIIKIGAVIIVSRSTHKPMVIGKHGSRIKEIGTNARASLEKHFNKKVFLDLFVRVEENWIDNEQLVTNLQGILAED